jgi:hypothetical protein
MARIVRGLPPNIDQIRGKLNPGPTTVYAYGDTIYSPATADLSQDLIRHEETHFAQQARVGGADEWWKRYLADPAFRLEQEIEAYRAQWTVITQLSRPERRRRLAHICKTLASGIYGGLLTKQQARELITADAAA